MPINEKRSSVRQTISLPASYRYTDQPLHTEQSMIVNLSKGGFCFQSKKSLNVGKSLKLAIELGPKESVVLDVAVAWCTRVNEKENFKIGTQITNSQGPDFERFLDFYCDKIRKTYLEKEPR